MAEKWLHWPDAIHFIRTTTDPPYSIGAAEAAMKAAVASGEIRVRRIAGVFGPGRGWVKVDNQWVEAVDRASAVLVSEDDLEFWLRKISSAKPACKADRREREPKKSTGPDLTAAADRAAAENLSENKFWKNRMRGGKYGRPACRDELKKAKERAGIPSLKAGGKPKC